MVMLNVTEEAAKRLRAYARARGLDDSAALEALVAERGQPDLTDNLYRDPPPGPVVLGGLEGVWMAEDFDAPLEDFKEYM